MQNYTTNTDGLLISVFQRKQMLMCVHAAELTGFYSGSGSWDRPCFRASSHLPSRIHHAAQLPSSGCRLRNRLDGPQIYPEAVRWACTIAISLYFAFHILHFALLIWYFINLFFYILHCVFLFFIFYFALHILCFALYFFCIAYFIFCILQYLPL